MNLPQIFLDWAYQLGSLALLYSCFCRLSFTDRTNTVRGVRWTFTTLTIVAALAAGAPFYGYAPDGVATSLVCSSALVQIVTAKYWRRGVPRQFRKG